MSVPNSFPSFAKLSFQTISTLLFHAEECFPQKGIPVSPFLLSKQCHEFTQRMRCIFREDTPKKCCRKKDGTTMKLARIITMLKVLLLTGAMSFITTGDYVQPFCLGEDLKLVVFFLFCVFVSLCCHKHNIVQRESRRSKLDGEL